MAANEKWLQTAATLPAAVCDPDATVGNLSWRHPLEGLVPFLLGTNHFKEGRKLAGRGENYIYS